MSVFPWTQSMQSFHRSLINIGLALLLFSALLFSDLVLWMRFRLVVRLFKTVCQTTSGNRVSIDSQLNNNIVFKSTDYETYILTTFADHLNCRTVAKEVHKSCSAWEHQRYRLLGMGSAISGVRAHYWNWRTAECSVCLSAGTASLPPLGCLCIADYLW